MFHWNVFLCTQQSKDPDLTNSGMRCTVLGAVSWVIDTSYVICSSRLWCTLETSTFLWAWCNFADLQKGPGEVIHVPQRRNGSEEREKKRGGEEALSSTFHKTRPLEIRWCRNLCIYCDVLKRSFIVQARTILALASLHANWNLCIHVSAQHSKMESHSNGNTVTLLRSKYALQEHQPGEKGGYYCETRRCGKKRLVRAAQLRGCGSKGDVWVIWEERKYAGSLESQELS